MQIRKKNGIMVDFDKFKVDTAISKALGESSESIEFGKFEELLDSISEKCFDGIDVEQIQNTIESQLMSFGLRETAKLYMGYRDEMKKVGKHGWEMTQLQKDIYNQKYRYNNESFQEFLHRVTNGNTAIEKLIKHKKFLPAGRILANRGLHKEGKKITLSNCYVLTPPSDNIESIFDTAKNLARTFSYGGGCGVDIGKLRPNGSKVNNNAETTSGATSFMDLYSMTTEIIGQRGRRGALMLSIPCTHPDLVEFIDIKKDLNKVTKANISIWFTGEFFRAVESKSEFELSFVVEDTGETITKVIDAYSVFHKFALNNWDMAEPGVLYNDRIRGWSLLSNDEDFEYAGVNP